MNCWRCNGLGLVLVRQEEGYSVYRACPTCRPPLAVQVEE